MKNSDYTVGFIGAGHMGRAIIEGLIQSSLNCSILVYEHHPEKLQDLVTANKIQLCSSQIELCRQVDAIILAVKPQSMKQTLEQCIGFDTQRKPLFISVAAGITTQQIKSGLQLNSDYPVVRAMPNTPAMIQMGVTGLYGQNLEETHQRLAQSIMQGIGQTIWLEQEDHVDVVTALSGSGPAYFYYICEKLILAATKQGLTQQTAKDLILDTAIGALTMAKGSSYDLQELRKQVTSPGGTTEAGLAVLKSANIQDTMITVITNATQRAKDLSDKLDT